MMVEEKRCPICHTEYYEVENYEVEDPSFDNNHIYKGWACICMNGHKFFMAETYKLISRECTSIKG